MRLSTEKYYAFMDYLFKSHPSLFLSFYDHINLGDLDEKGEGTVLIQKPPEAKEDEYKRLLEITDYWK